MLTLKIGEKELNVKFGYKATVKTNLLSALAKFEKQETEGMEGVENLFKFLPTILLIGLQKFHFDEYGFEYETGKGKNEQEDKIFSLIDDYMDTNEEEDVITLYNALINELLQNGFLKSKFMKEVNAQD